MPRSHNTLKEQHTPRKQLGQNFLADKNILQKIVRAAAPQPTDTVLEIGAGLGHLTRELAATNANIVSVELDIDLLKKLQTEFASSTNVKILEGDILNRPPAAWLADANAAPPYLVVANIPYYITSAILRYLLESPTPPTRIVVLVQREVSQQLLSKPPHASLLGVSVQYFGTPSVVSIVPAGAFYPRPSVDSAIVKIEVAPRASAQDSALFFRVVRAGFGAKRKQLHNALTSGLPLRADYTALLLKRANIDPTRRAETLSLAEWDTLTRHYIPLMKLS